MVMLCNQAFEKKAGMLGEENGGRMDTSMDETDHEQGATSRSALNSKGNYKCFGFGYNGFAQLIAKTTSKDNETSQPSSCVVPSPVPLNVDCVNSIAASWSCSLYLKGWFYGKLWF